MAGRMRVPAAEELLRGPRQGGPRQGGPRQGDPDQDTVEDTPEAAPGRLRAVPDGWGERPAPVAPPPPGPRRSSGRERHEEKITVYISSGELVELERARLTLRAAHGLAVDRGRLVREAVAAVLEDLDVRGEDSALVRRLHQGE